MDTLVLFASLLIMGAIVVAVFATYQISASPRLNLQRRLGAILSDQPDIDLNLFDYASLRTKRAGRVPIIGKLLEGRTWTDDVGLRLDQADIKLTVSEYVSARFFVAFVAGVVPLLFLGRGGLGIVLMVIAGLVGYMLPAFYVSFARGRRISKLNMQLIEALSLVSNSLKAGFGLMQALDLASREMKHPISTELRRTLHDINVGSSTEDALQSFARRSGSEDLDIVITAMVIQQSTGGNLAEILDNVGHTMRERIRIRGEIKTLTTQQMLTGFIIGGLPIALMGLFSVMSPSYIMPLFNETMGNIMLVGAGILELFGILVIRKILAIEV